MSRSPFFGFRGRLFGGQPPRGRFVGDEPAHVAGELTEGVNQSRPRRAQTVIPRFYLLAFSASIHGGGDATCTRRAQCGPSLVTIP